MDNDNHNEKYDTSNGPVLLAGLLLGALAGAVTMLLLAPQSGKKTRRQIRRKGRDLREQTTDSIEDGVSQARARAQDVKTNIHGRSKALQQRGQDALDDGKERFAAAVDAG
jgi:gas vesicle protein